LGLDPEDVDSDVDVVEVDQADLCVAFALVATATFVTPASGYEIEVLIRQFDRVSEIGNILHVGLLSVFDVSGGIFAATSSLAARRQSGCTAAKIFCAAPRGALFSFPFFILSFFILLSCQSGKRLPS
jgi:hypothetical protein